MIEWGKITEEQMRERVVDDLARKRDEMLLQAERQEELALHPACTEVGRRKSEARASCSRRQAAHYQQALDMLTAAPMPAKEET